MKEYLDRSLEKYSEWENPLYYAPADIDVNYDIRTSCKRNEIISAKSLSIRSSYSDDLVSYYDPSDDRPYNTVSINFYSYTLIRGSMFRFSLGISKEILSKKHSALRRDKHEVRTNEGWLRSYVFLFRQKNGVYVYP